MKRRSFLRLVGLGGAATAIPLPVALAVSPAVEVAPYAAEMQWLLTALVVPIPFCNASDASAS